MNSKSISRGFTLLELLLVIVIVTVVAALGVFSFTKLNSSQALEKSADLVVSTLNEARALTLSSKGDTQYGVYIEPSQIVLFSGNSYSSSDPANRVNTLHSLVGIQNINLSGGGTSVIFERLTGGTNQAGTLEIFLRSSPGTYRTITITGTGIVELD